MKQERINAIRDLGDVLAEYIHAENDKRFFNSFLMARNYAALRSALVRANVGMLRREQPPAITLILSLPSLRRVKRRLTPIGAWRVTCC